MKLIGLVFAAALLAGCHPDIAQPVAPNANVRPDTAAVCAQHCSTMGLQLSAVVVISNQFGCVCAPAPQGPGPGAAGAAAAAGGAVISAAIVTAEAAALAVLASSKH